jgi:hypothetical protein
MFGKIKSVDKFDEAMKIARENGWYTVDNHPPFPFLALCSDTPSAEVFKINTLIDAEIRAGQPFCSEGSESVVRNIKTRKYYLEDAKHDSGPFNGYWFAIPITEVIYGVCVTPGIPDMHTIFVESGRNTDPVPMPLGSRIFNAFKQIGN